MRDVHAILKKSATRRQERKDASGQRKQRHDIDAPFHFHNIASADYDARFRHAFSRPRTHLRSLSGPRTSSACSHRLLQQRRRRLIRRPRDAGEGRHIAADRRRTIIIRGAARAGLAAKL